MFFLCIFKKVSVAIWSFFYRFSFDCLMQQFDLFYNFIDIGRFSCMIGRKEHTGLVRLFIFHTLLHTNCKEVGKVKFAEMMPFGGCST